MSELAIERAKAAVRERYDRFAAQELAGGAYEPMPPAKQYFRARKLAAALELGAFPSGAKLLEVGCSAGQFTLPLAGRGYDMTGVDLSPNAIEVAERRAAACGQVPAFLVRDAERLEGLADGVFDGVCSFSTLRYVPQLPQALAEIRRVLKPEGRAVLDFPNRWCPWLYVKPWLGSERHPHDRWFTAAALRQLFAQAGFVKIRIQPLLFTPTVAPGLLLPLFVAADRVGERTPGLRWLAGVLMVVAERP